MRDVTETRRCSAGNSAASTRWREPPSRPPSAADRSISTRPGTSSACRPASLPALLAVAGHVRTQRKGRTVTYSPKVFLPVTNLCLDRCAYCTFRKDPDEPDAWTMLPEEIRAWCRAGGALGCIEALMCLGDKPERAYPLLPADAGRARPRRARSTTSPRAARSRSSEGLLPHTNAGVMTRDEMAAPAAAQRQPGPDARERQPAPARPRRGPSVARRTRTRRCACRCCARPASCAIPFTTGILLGIGETPRRARRQPARHRRPASALRPHPGDHRPELPRQADDAHGDASGARELRRRAHRRRGAPDAAAT